MTRVTVLTPNPAVDLTYRVARQRIGETVRVTGVTRRAGGKGLNVAAVLRALDVDAVAVHPSAGSPGRWIEEELSSAGIRSVAVPVPGQTRSTVTVVDDVDHPTVLTEPGPRLDADDWTAVCAAVREHCTAGGVLVVAGSLPPGVGPEEVAAVVSAGRAAGATTVVDVSGPGLLAAAAAGADLVTPNAAEALEATGATDLDEAVADLRRAGAGAVVVSRGAAGLLAVTREERLEHVAVPGVVGNPTGAGDAATAGIATALLRGVPLPVALRWAAVLGAAAVLRPVAGEVDVADLPVLAARLPDLPPVWRELSLPTPAPHRSAPC